MAPVIELGPFQKRFGRFVVQLGDLEPEEEELGVERRALLGDARDECSTRRVGHVGGEMEMGEVRDAGEDGLDPLALLDGFRQLGRTQLGDLAVVPIAKRGRCLVRLVDVASSRGSLLPS